LTQAAFLRFISQSNYISSNVCTSRCKRWSL
jgi:hypothetical protein